MNNSSLAGKSVLITGASRRIGFAIAQRLGQLGARIALCGRNQDTLDSACARLRGDAIDAFALTADVSRSDQVASLVEKTLARFRAIDFLINNAGTSRFGPVQEFSETDWDTVLDTNLKGVFLVSRAVMPAMISRGHGHIVNISSLAGKNSFPGGSLYCASKWGLLGLTYSMAEDLRAHGIRVTAICPGSVATEFGHPSSKNAEKML
ncbi:MAG: SDR family oxidoreductase, partial [Candidatus Acidiferrales bacterium]